MGLDVDTFLVCGSSDDVDEQEDDSLGLTGFDCFFLT